MRGHLRGHPHPARLALAHQPHRARRGDVGDVHVGARQLREENIARDHHVLGDPGLAEETELGGDEALVHGASMRKMLILGMADDGHAEGQGVFHGPAVDLGIHHALAVVGEGDAARLGELGHLRELLALEPTGDRADWVDAHHPFHAGLGHDEVGDGTVVVDGQGIGHARHCGEAARRGCARAGGDGLLVLVAGLAEVDVDVDEPRADHLSRGRYHLGTLRGLESLADLGDAPVGHQHVGHRVEAVSGIDDPATLDEKAHAALLPARRKRTAMRTATPLVT